MRPDSYRDADRRYYHAHKEQRNAAAKAWKQDNRERYNDYMRDYRRRRKQEGKP